MTAATVAVWNAALSAAKGRGRLSSLTENSVEREECEQWYELVRQTVAEANFWPGNTTTAYLALLSQRDPASTQWSAADPKDPYKYKYALPSDYLRPQYLATYARFEVYWDNETSRNVLVCDDPKALLTYTFDQDNVNAWSPGQKQAIIYGLAAHIAPGLGCSRAEIERNINMANRYLQSAQASAQFQQNRPAESIPRELLARGFSGSMVQTRYYYPLGGVFQGAQYSAD
jgi:hypothetical protein